MKRCYDSRLRANVVLDEASRLRAINHLDEYRETGGLRGRAAAAAYLRDLSGEFGIADDALRRLDQAANYLDPREAALEYRRDEEKRLFDSETYAFRQTWLNTPVWAAGVTVTLKQAPTRVIAATDSSASGIDAKLPPAEAIERYRKLFEGGSKAGGVRTRGMAASTEASAASAERLSEILGKPGKGAKATSTSTDIPLQLISGRFYVYRYEAASRTQDAAHPAATHASAAHGDEQAICGTPPTLPLPAIPKSIREGHWYLVAELIVRYPWEGSPMNWRALVEVETNSVLYLRALTSGVNGLVFLHDPITSTGDTANTPDASNAELNPHRTSVTLPNLNPPSGGKQYLQGSLATLTDLELKTVSPPNRNVGLNFDYDARSDEFAAVNAYYHVDRFFQLVEELGFPLASYFDGTAFPVEVDPRGKGNATDQGNTINAHCVGDGDGIDHCCFALADLGDTVHPMGIAADWRVVLHELGGHGILHDHVGGPNFGFAHSAGDSFAVILNDYLSEWHNGAALDRFLLSPFVPAVPRRSDRSVAAGWGWGGANDVGGYSSEQILSTTLFRAYRSIGGDSTSLARREFAARCMAYLVLRAVGQLTPASNPASAAQFLAALQTADAGNWTSEGVFGGAYAKVLAWAFEKQNLNGGALPDVDVYIDDGRAGEYPYQAVHWNTTTIWNRRIPDGLTGHQEAALGESNYAYVRIRNRGSQIAHDVVVKAYHCKPSAGVLWPNDLQPMSTAQLSAGTLQPGSAEEKIVGPFEWTPVSNAWGHDCMLMVVSASGDPSNVDNFTAGEVVEDWRLVPNDNNVGQRNVTLVPGGGGLAGLKAGLQGKGFWVGNPGRASALITVEIELPPLLVRRGWRIELAGLPANGLRLKAGEQRLLSFELHAGANFTRAEAAAEKLRDIVVSAHADGALLGGMVYQLDPEIEHPFNETAPADGKGKCREQARQLLECLDLPAGDVGCVRVSRISLDIEMKRGDCCD
jgi:zinc metalloprotease ZmpB